MRLSLAIISLMAMAPAAMAQTESADSTEQGFVFTDVKVLPTTEVKDQNKSGTCWSFSGTSFIEDEILRKGGEPIHLSEMYTVRNCYADKADRYVRNYGQVNFSPGGSCPDVTYVMKKYGAMPDEAYSGLHYGEDKHVHGELNDGMKAYLDVIIKKPNKTISTAWRKALDGILDAYLGEVPTTFTYNGVEYIPQSFVSAIGINPDDYVAITSFTHHPFYETFTLEVPDNWINFGYYNVPLDEMKEIVDYALDHGFPIAWAADVSEEGFDWYNGVAVMPVALDTENLSGTELSRWVSLDKAARQKEMYDTDGPSEEITVTQESRQEMYDNQSTTDDHGMEIIGYATDQNGKRYYKVKNSWGTMQKYGGYLYVSEPYFLAKTMDIYVHRDAIPKHIAKKLNK